MTSALFTPLRLAGLTLPNRIGVSPMCMYSAVDGVAQAFHPAHIGSLVLSGAGLVIMEATGVEPIGRVSGQCLGLWNDGQEAVLAGLLQHVRSFSDTALGIQLGHAGRKGSCYPGWVKRGTQQNVAEGGWPLLVAPSAHAWGDGWTVPQALDRAGMDRIRDAFVQAVKRADRAGFDLIEIHGAHGYLLNSFVSPLANFRTDAYGGSLENRMRYPLEVVRAMRDALSPDKPLGIRINGDDWHDEGSTIEETVVYARALKAAGIDYITTSGGFSAPGVKFPPLEPGLMVPFAERVKSECEVITAAVGLIVMPEYANALIADGRADMVMIARGVLDDPRWGLHAAIALGEPVHYPPQYARASPEVWLGYKWVHGASGKTQH